MGRYILRYLVLNLTLFSLGCGAAPFQSNAARSSAGVESEVISFAHLGEQEALDSIDELQRKRRTAVFTGVEPAAQLRNLRVRMFFLNPEWSVDTREAIINEEVFIGMSVKQVLASWGKPDAVHEERAPAAAVSAKQQWIYNWSGQRLFFSNGRLVGFDNLAPKA